MTRVERGIRLQGRIFLTGAIEVVTGLHIGGPRTGLPISGVQNSVVRDPLTWRPYIPGSTLKGKLRSLLEKHYSKSQQWLQGGVRIHVCHRFDEKGNRVPDEEAYNKCEVCPIFGTPAQVAVLPTRLTVRDVPLDEDSARRLAGTRSELPFSEVKWETALDRVTAAARPRQIERVPAGTVFAPMELIYHVYEQADVERFLHVLDAMQLLEDDYLGGLGSRGSGKVVFRDVALKARSRQRYGDAAAFEKMPSLSALLARAAEAVKWLQDTLAP